VAVALLTNGFAARVAEEFNTVRTEKADAESAGAAIWIGTSAAYTALTPKNATTIYYVTD